MVDIGHYFYLFFCFILCINCVNGLSESDEVGGRSVRELTLKAPFLLLNEQIQITKFLPKKFFL